MGDSSLQPAAQLRELICHMGSVGITQCYLLPSTGDILAFTPAN